MELVYYHLCGLARRAPNVIARHFRRDGMLVKLHVPWVGTRQTLCALWGSSDVFYGAFVQMWSGFITFMMYVLRFMKAILSRNRWSCNYAP